MILRLQKKLETIDFEEDPHTLHERNDSFGIYYLFDTKSVKKQEILSKGLHS